MVGEPILVLEVLIMVSARTFSSLSFSECVVERLPYTHHTQVPLFPFIPMYPSYQKKIILCQRFLLFAKSSAPCRSRACRSTEKLRGFVCSCVAVDGFLAWLFVVAVVHSQILWEADGKKRKQVACLLSFFVPSCPWWGLRRSRHSSRQRFPDTWI